MVAIATVLVVAALMLSKPVTLPLVLGVFMIVLAWPLQRALERRMPRGVALTLTALVVLTVIAAVAGIFAWSVAQVIEHAPEIERQVGALRERVAGWASARGLPSEVAPSEGPGAAGATEGSLSGAVRSLYAMLVMIGLAFAFLVLGMLEVHDFEHRFATRFRRELGEEILELVVTISHKVRRHLIALSITSAISGVATGLFALVMGLELAAVWGITAFVLNLVPTVGPTVAVVPPTLYALFQFGGSGRTLAVFLGMGALQFVIGNFVDPKVEGRVFSLSPIAVLFAIVFWGWVWGAFGALLAVPITAALVIVSEHFPGTRWIATLVARARSEESEGEGERDESAQGRFS